MILIFLFQQPMASLPGYETESYKLVFGYDGSDDSYAHWERLVVCNDVLITPQRNLFAFFRFRPGQPKTTNIKKSQAAFLALSSLKQWRFLAEFMMSWDRYREVRRDTIFSQYINIFKDIVIFIDGKPHTWVCQEPRIYSHE